MVLEISGPNLEDKINQVSIILLISKVEGQSFWYFFLKITNINF